MARSHSVARWMLVLALTASTQGLLLAQAAWLTNQEWIAETLCVNPGTDCDGKCQLADRMEQLEHGTHGHSHESGLPLLELALSVRAHVTEHATVPSPDAVSVGGPSGRLAFDTGREASQDVFHPPQGAAAA